MSDALAEIFKEQRKYVTEMSNAFGSNYAHPEMVFPDHGDIYLDIRWRDKTISPEGFPSYMPYEDASASANPLSLDPYSRAKVSALSTAPAKYIAEILVYYNDGADI